jgi:hypothetical protein
MGTAHYFFLKNNGQRAELLLDNVLYVPKVGVPMLFPRHLETTKEIDGHGCNWLSEKGILTFF